jgi:peptidoglycan hydrolase CwlO-like protein
MQKILRKTSVITRTATLLLLVALFAGGSSLVRADSYDAKIDAIDAKNDQKREQLNSLYGQASDYRAAINQLQSRINTLQASINANRAEQVVLQKQIEEKRLEIERQRVVLGDVLRSMYVDGDMSAIEMLATSNNLSDYVDKEEYRNSVQNQIQDTLAQIAVLQKQLQAKKTKVDSLIADQKAQQSQLASDKQKQSSLLSYNQQQQDAFTSEIRKNNAEIARLQAAQAAAQAAYAASHGVSFYGTASNGGYPNRWANAPQDTKVDSWGMLNRECVSYVAWKVNSVGRHMPHWGGDYTHHRGGNAYRWIDNADIDHIRRTGSAPSPGAWRPGIAVVWDTDDGVGSYGHVAYLDSVNSDGSIEVSQYNFFGRTIGHGHFSRMHVSASDANQLDYIWF